MQLDKTALREDKRKAESSRQRGAPYLKSRKKKQRNKVMQEQSESRRGGSEGITKKILIEMLSYNGKKL